ncbi:mitochondrial carrier protein [Trypanosoma cruzi Dm28c]|uniref:Mitochondrial carrier protein n=1 Tax=Trypanosoma cruzi Dm28c TaxID=1416333 RepID=V5BCT4_TRYCR|nr:mitochondrial carrier protein [Trypanosoma cruzi Dm28c]
MYLFLCWFSGSSFLLLLLLLCACVYVYALAGLLFAWQGRREGSEERVSHDSCRTQKLAGKKKKKKGGDGPV